MVAEAEVRARGRAVVWLAGAALAWFLFRQVSLEWRINSQYSYGWVVPVLAGYLFWNRWKWRPAPGNPVRYVAGFVVFLGLVLPLRLVGEANPDWRLVSWAAGLVVVGFFWLGLLAAGGWSWWRHFAFAAAFVLVAVPWPTPVENLLVQSLMRWVAGVAVEALNWLGIAAQQEGNLVRLTNGTLGVDEACSGVRSFQATLMAALFFGELYRLGVGRRVVLVGCGIGVAVALNLFRAVLLAWIAARDGIGALERWHDPAGYVVLALTFFGLLGIAKVLGKKIVAPVSTVAGNIFVLRRAAWMVVGWLIICEGTTAAWYRAHEREDVPQARWRVEWPVAEAPISENIRTILRYNEGESAIWNRADGSQWHLFFFSWKPGRAAANLARNHRPETCLPATGFEFVRSRGVTNYHVNGIDLPIERIEFAKGGQRLHVYYCLWEDRISPGAQGAELLTRANRMRAVLEGRRHLGQRVLEVVIAGNENAERADEAVGVELPKWIKVESR